MEWKYRQNFQVMPGVRLTYGKNGIQTELKSNTLLPESDNRLAAEKLRHQLCKPYEDRHEIKSSPLNKLTSKDLTSFKEVLMASSQSYDDTLNILNGKKAEETTKHKTCTRLERHLFTFLFKKKIARLQSELAQLTEEISELKNQLALATIELEVDSDDEFDSLYKMVRQAFGLLQKSHKKWDLTSSRATNQYRERTAAANTVTRSEINIQEKHLPILRTQSPAISFNNINGGDLYLYPGFLIIYESKNDFAIINYCDIEVLYRQSQFIETEKVPADAKITGHTWFKVNKDGSPDKRFASNYQIPIALYGEIHFSSKTGLNERYSFSNNESAMLFHKAITSYTECLKKANSLPEAIK